MTAGQSERFYNGKGSYNHLPIELFPSTMKYHWQLNSTRKKYTGQASNKGSNVYESAVVKLSDYTSTSQMGVAPPIESNTLLLSPYSLNGLGSVIVGHWRRQV